MGKEFRRLYAMVPEIKFPSMFKDDDYVFFREEIAGKGFIEEI